MLQEIAAWSIQTSAMSCDKLRGQNWCPSNKIGLWKCVVYTERHVHNVGKIYRGKNAVHDHLFIIHTVPWVIFKFESFFVLNLSDSTIEWAQEERFVSIVVKYSVII